MFHKLKLRWLVYFDALTHHETLQQAANQLFITQQALSNYLERLEARLEVRLFSRNRQGQRTLTPEGEQLKQALKPVLEDAKALQQIFEDLSETTLKGRLSVAIPPQWINPELIQQIQTFQMIHPDLMLSVISTENESELEQALLNQSLDLAIYAANKQREATLLYAPLFKTTCNIVNYRAETRSWEEIDFIGYQSTSDLPNLWNEVLYPRKIKYTSNDFLQAVNWCQQGLGAIYIPLAAADFWLRQHKLFALGAGPVCKEIQVKLVWNPTCHRNPAKEALIYHLSKFFFKQPHPPEN